MAIKCRILTLVACAQTTWERDGRVLGSADIPLSEDGHMEARAEAELFASELSALLGSDSPQFTIHHPPDEGAAETAQALANAVNGKTRAVDDLKDPHLGLLEGITAQMFADRYPKRYKQYNDDPLSLAPPEGEELAEAQARLFRAVARIMTKGRAARSADTVVVLHQLNLGMLRCWLGCVPCTRLWELNQSRPRVERYAIMPDMIERLAAAAQPAAQAT
jgi:broad specificity phosphatase PhoE